MPQLAKSYQLSHDIDWFFNNGERIFHCASNTALIPGKFSDRHSLKIAQEIIAYSPILYSLDEININEVYEEQFVLRDYNQLLEILGELTLTEEEYRSQYLESFIKMAQRGLWSYDHPLDAEENEYILVAYPKDIPGLEDLLEMRHPLQMDQSLRNVIPSGEGLHIEGDRLLV